MRAFPSQTLPAGLCPAPSRLVPTARPQGLNPSAKQGHTIGAKFVKGAFGTAYGGFALDCTFDTYSFMTLPTGLNPEVAGFPKGVALPPLVGNRL